MSTTLYVDLMSQPSRACLIFCRLHGLPVAESVVNIKKGEHRSAAYRSINPLGLVPFLVDGDFTLPESAAIMAYLAQKHRGLVPDHWYPEDIRERAKVDSLLHWWHTTVRFGASSLVRERVLAPVLGVPSLIPREAFSTQARDAVAALAAGSLCSALRVIEGHWLGQGREFLAGGRPCLADLLIASDLEQLRMMDGAVEGPGWAELMGPYERVRGWLDRLEKYCMPHSRDVQRVLVAATAKVVGMRGRSALNPKL
ncbi:unnamed protein product [Ostreobium quekettii]|uniref:Glutathione S-transferase n=1 Tax=Ostreobium quekettii TaxID=121088 RepID=A0A8S1INI6_9CHLO|nr:unnamed protein product [Ostreobium quekettii]